MKIGIHVGSAFSEKRTGVEEYVYQLIKNLAKLNESKVHEFELYVNTKTNKIIPRLPKNFKAKILRAPFMWTNLRLPIQLFVSKPDILLMPANFFLFFYPRVPVVSVIHGLEFEYFPEYYSKKMLYYLQKGTKKALKKSKRIITVSESTKSDLVDIYGANKNSIFVIHHGVDDFVINKDKKANPKERYILYIGRIESKKNLEAMVNSFNLVKKKYKVPHKLFLVGGKGYGYEKIKELIGESEYKDDIVLTGYVSKEQKESLYKNATMFLFPSFYEGFGMPILEAQLRSIPVITSNNSSMVEIAGEGAVLIDPFDNNEIAEAIYQIIQDENFKNKMVLEGIFNTKKYSWKKCAKETLNILIK